MLCLVFSDSSEASPRRQEGARGEPRELADLLGDEAVRDDERVRVLQDPQRADGEQIRVTQPTPQRQ